MDAEFSVDRQGRVVVLLGGVVVAAKISDVPEFEESVGETRLVVEFLINLQGRLRFLLGGAVVAANLTDVRKPDVNVGGVAGAGWDPAECFVRQLAFGGPCSPGMQLVAS